MSIASRRRSADPLQLRELDDTAHAEATLDAIVALAGRFTCEPGNRGRVNREDPRGVSHTAVLHHLFSRVVVP